MGRDKSRLWLGRRTMLGQIRATAKALRVPLRVIRRDAVPRCGPLGGIYTALKSTEAGAVMFLACDMPFVTEALLRSVHERYGRQALFVTSDRGTSFPFMLPREALATVARQIEQGHFSLHELARKLKARKFCPPAGRRAELRNINTPREWARAVRAWNRVREKRGRKRET